MCSLKSINSAQTTLGVFLNQCWKYDQDLPQSYKGCSLQAVTKSLRVFVTNSLTVEWRKSLTKQLHQEYFARRKYYDLNALNNGPLQV